MEENQGNLQFEERNMVCRHCNNATVLQVIGQYTHKEDFYEDNDILKQGPCVHEETTFTFLKCRTCFLPTIERKFYNSEEHTIPFGPEITTLFPTKADIPDPSKDMPEHIAKIYKEARAIFPRSARSSAALLRLVIQMLCQHLGQPGKNINDDIGALVRNGLSPQVQQALDIVRVIGNNAVHPGVIDLNDNTDLAQSLFELINFIVHEMISHPRLISDIYNKLPQSNLDAIKKRDEKN